MKFFSFIPKDDKFYRLLEELSACALDCARHLKLFVESTDESVRDRASKDIDGCKARAKKTVARVTDELCRSYITPFDREDVQELANQLYKITKTMEKVQERMMLHGLSPQHTDFSGQVGVILAEAEAMDVVIRDLSTSGNGEIVRQVQKLHDLEQEGDELLGRLLVNLFNAGHDTRDLILRKDIYDMLEKVIDRYRDIAAIALQIVLKHS